MSASTASRETRLRFPPAYAIVGVYRLCTDPSLYVPVWDKVRHGVRRGAVVGLGWALLTFNAQRAFVRVFLVNSPRVAGLSHETVFGHKLPLDIVTYATVMLVSSQVSLVLRFFLARNLRVARARAWDLTVASRGKGPAFWGRYVEEWQAPPHVRAPWQQWLRSGLLRAALKKVLLAPLALYPVVGIVFVAGFQACATAHHLHAPYFAAKHMTPHDVAVFVEERKWSYRAFGFVAALLEALPVVGLAFTISNRVGAAMWAHDLEKRQHLFASGELQPIPPPGKSSGYASGEAAPPEMAGGWQDESSPLRDADKVPK